MVRTHPTILIVAGATRVTTGAVVSTRKTRVPLVPFWRLSLAVTDQLWRPSARVKVVTLKVLLAMVPLKLAAPSRKKVKVVEVARLSVTVKLNSMVLEWLVLLAGAMRVTVGAVLSMKKVRVALVPVLLVKSETLTNQVWRPLLMPVMLVTLKVPLARVPEKLAVPSR